jgi:transposase
MVEIVNDEVQSFPLNHHGLIVAVCKDLNLADRIDALLPIHQKRKVSPGTSVVAMVLNGLGFTNRRLYLTPQFFAIKPVARLLDAQVNAEDLSDSTLGHTLDDIVEYGVNTLFGSVAFGRALENNLLGSLAHLDSISLSVQGDYSQEPNEISEPAIVQLTHGHSKDHRPDLKQTVLFLVVNGPSSIPIWMEAHDGNNSDKSSIHETIRRVYEFQKQIGLENDFKWVADSALYSKEKLLANNEYH